MTYIPIITFHPSKKVYSWVYWSLQRWFQLQPSKSTWETRERFKDLQDGTLFLSAWNLRLRVDWSLIRLLNRLILLWLSQYVIKSMIMMTIKMMLLLIWWSPGEADDVDNATADDMPAYNVNDQFPLWSSDPWDIRLRTSWASNALDLLLQVLMMFDNTASDHYVPAIMNDDAIIINLNLEIIRRLQC